jgi:hypothetical protein
MLLVQLGINSTRDVWKFAKLDSPAKAHAIVPDIQPKFGAFVCIFI